MIITAKSTTLKKIAGQMQHTSSNFNDTATMISRVVKSLDYDMESYAIVSAQLNKSKTSLMNLLKKTNNLQQGLMEIATLYQRTEKAIVEKENKQ